MSKRQSVIFWGLVVVVAYLYAYEVCLIGRFAPTPTAIPEHGYESRQSTEWISGGLNPDYS